jgi:hypothetical protein
MRKKVAIIGTVGLPSNYGGFETLVENLVKYGMENHPDIELTVFNSKKKSIKHKKYLNANMVYLPFKANGYKVDCREKEELAAKITSILDDELKYKEMSIEAIKMSKNFSFDVFIKKIKHIIKEV